MAAQKTQAIVIRTLPLQEFHKIITFYTPDFGKVKAVAYGIKSPKSRLGGSLELLNYGTLIFQTSRKSGITEPYRFQSPQRI